MDHRTARLWQDILLFGGAIIACVGAWGFDSVPATLVGFGMMILSIIVWWMYYRCPQCREHLGRGTPRHCPNCGVWLGKEPEPVEKKKIQHKKKR